MSDATTGYARALLEVAQADGNLDVVKSELAAVAQAVDANEGLRSSLSDRLLPAAVRGQIIDDVLAHKVSDTTRGLVALIATSGRGAQLSQIVNSFAAAAAAGSGKSLATVRSAVPLSDDQQRRLAAALAQSTGSEVDLQVVIDPSVVGGAVTTIGDTVIDGSLRTRLNKMREVI